MATLTTQVTSTCLNQAEMGLGASEMGLTRLLKAELPTFVAEAALESANRDLRVLSEWLAMHEKVLSEWVVAVERTS